MVKYILIIPFLMIGKLQSGNSDLLKQSVDIGLPLFLSRNTLDSCFLADQIDAFLHHQNECDEIVKTGFAKNDYLEIIERQVRIFQQCQDDSGRIIDPVEKQEMFYTTPCYAHSVAILTASGYTKDMVLIESGMHALDAATEDMSNNRSPGKHGDFYTWPVMFAFRLYKGFADEKRYATWSNNISKMNPQKFYRMYHNYFNNWNVVNLAGEFLRYQNGYTSSEYTEISLNHQFPHFTEFGMYLEEGEPLAYDLFARYYITSMLALGYKGAHADLYREIVAKGAWTSLFMQSPFGELPTSHRSSQHLWNEALQCVIFEIYAKEYAKGGDLQKAGAFKRAAMLSLGNIQTWIRPDGSGYIVKNKYPLEARHGYEDYSVYSCYNMLTTSILASAWLFSDDTVKEKPAPVDIGGYVLYISEFHKIFASAGGSYLEYDTHGDQIYNPTGIIRVQMKGNHPQLGPSDGCGEKFAGKGVSIATGPSWQSGDGKWTSLSELNLLDPIIEIMDESIGKVRFRVTYHLPYEEGNPLKITETVTVEKGKITIEDQLYGDITQMRVTWPVLLFNGKNHSTIHITNNTAIVELEGKDIKFQVVEPENSFLFMSAKQFAHRNGMVEPLIASIKGKQAKYTISLLGN